LRPRRGRDANVNSVSVYQPSTTGTTTEVPSRFSVLPAADVGDHSPYKQEVGCSCGYFGRLVRLVGLGILAALGEGEDRRPGELHEPQHLLPRRHGLEVAARLCVEALVRFRLVIVVAAGGQPSSDVDVVAMVDPSRERVERVLQCPGMLNPMAGSEQSGASRSRRDDLIFARA
jgi:hypothetical protein